MNIFLVFVQETGAKNVSVLWRWRQLVGLLVNRKGHARKRWWSHSGTVTRIFQKALKRTRKDISRYGRSTGWDSNEVPPEYNSRAWPLLPKHCINKEIAHRQNNDYLWLRYWTFDFYQQAVSLMYRFLRTNGDRGFIPTDIEFLRHFLHQTGSGAHPLSVQWIFAGVRQPESEANHSSLSTAAVKMRGK
jgi:hypothetical protein